MKRPRWYAHSVALLLVAALASCSGKQKTAEPAPPPPKPTAAQEAQRSFQVATQEQQQLAEQMKRLEAAHKAVVAAEQQLAQAQAQEQQERAKAQQIQQQASQHLQDSVEHAEQAQAGVAGVGAALEGMQTFAGRVAEAAPTQVVLQGQGGRTMTFNVDPRTRVLVGDAHRSVADIQQGADAQVAYDPRGGKMTALVIRVTPAGTQPAPSQPAPSQPAPSQAAPTAPHGQGTPPPR
jgi:hypothetical protein